MLRKLLSVLAHPIVLGIALVVYAVAMAVATFIENDYGPTTSKALIYNTKWFELLMLLLVFNFVTNIFKYRLYKRKKWPVLLFHLAFIVTLLGSFVTRYFGFEGTVPIREGSHTDIIYSDMTYINVRVDDGAVMKSYEKPVLFGQIGKNKYRFNDRFGQDKENKIPFSITLNHYTAKAKETFEPDENGINTLHLVKSGSGARQDIYIAEGSVTHVGPIPFSFNHYIRGGINFFQEEDGLTLQSPMSGSCMEMRTGKLMPVPKDSISGLFLRHLYSLGNLQFVVAQVTKGKRIVLTAPKKEQKNYPYDLLSFTLQSGERSKTIEVRGMKGVVLPSATASLNGLNFSVSYGSKAIKMPFLLKLRDFQMEHYPGTNSASSYASEITVLDMDNTMEYRIFMNHVLDYKGYRFFQASYDRDEKGTVLSVNHDYWGTFITYIGYSLMGFGMLFTLFLTGSRFQQLSQTLKRINTHKGSAMCIFMILIALVSQAQNTDATLSMCVSREHADAFGRLLIQDHQGRIKPINTYAIEALRKVYKKDMYRGLTAEQVLLSAQLDPKYWGQRPIIRVKTNVLSEKILSDLSVKNSLTSLANYFEDGDYYLKTKVSEALRLNKTSRTATDQEIIDLDERVNVWWNILNGSLLKIYPKKNDPNHTWYTGTDSRVFLRQDTMVLRMHQLYLLSLQEAIKTNDYTEADEYLSLISQYQQQLAKDIIPSADKVAMEIKYNQWNIFKKLLIYYMILGFVLLVLAFVDLLKPHLTLTRVGLKIFITLIVLGMLVHIVGLGMRWYISGHEPWSNGYEAVIFVAFITVMAGLIFSYNRSKFTIAATTLFSSFLLGVARGSMMNPEITNLEPVLKSYWLMIHVAVITASYGFLGLGALLGFIVLLLYIIRTLGNAKSLNRTIKELTITNESTLTVGLFTLSIGTFLGGVWANESWGRYWGWDPKEVWALISIIVYVFVLHMRMIPGLKGEFAFNTASLFSISTLIMTFFGVNYYLSGMHSYAGGDPVPIPNWIYPTVALFILFAVVSYFRYKKHLKH